MYLNVKDSSGGRAGKSGTVAHLEAGIKANLFAFSLDKLLQNRLIVSAFLNKRAFSTYTEGLISFLALPCQQHDGEVGYHFMHI